VPGKRDTPRRPLAFSAPEHPEELTRVIDRIRHDIQARLDQLLAEIDKLGRALAALDPRAGSDSPLPARRSSPSATTPARKAAAATPSAPRRRPATRAGGTTPAATRSAAGQTHAKVLAALSSERPMTAGEVAAATGLARPTVSTTLSRLTKNGKVAKAERGYRLPAA
jgi:DNA-binding transcriptional ArsR family regulator